MILDTLKTTYTSQKDKPALFIRTALKEVIQNYILEFIYNHKEFKNLIFTGGTCLRKLYNLSRLSEDVDFNFVKNFDIVRFADSVKKYFIEDLQYKNISTKIANNQRSVFVKFPNILTELGIAKTRSDSSQLFIRCDFTKESVGIYQIQVVTITTTESTFFVLAYDLETLFASKIVAFLERKYYKGKNQKESFKGRDIYDLVWFLSRFKSSGFENKPNWERIFKVLNINQKSRVIQMLEEKIQKIDHNDVKVDLEPFLESQKFTNDFANNFKSMILRDLKYL